MEELGFPEEKINQVRENRTVPALGGEPLKRCIFLKDNLCQIYEIRPRQCREYPLEIESEDSNIVILIDLDCPRAEKIKKAIEKGNISRWLEKILENKEIEEIKLRSFYEEKITSYYYKP